MARKKRIHVCAECGELAPEDDFLCDECRARKKAEAAAKAAATRARNAEIRAEEERVRELAEKRADLAEINTRLPTLYEEYEGLLEKVNKGQQFDRKGWNRLDRLQNNILGFSARKRTLMEELEIVAC